MNSPHRVLRWLILTAVVCLAAQTAHAQVTIIGNLDGNDGTQTADVDDLRNKAVGFTMPAGDDYTLDFCTLRLETYGADITVFVELWTDNGGQLGTQIEALSSPTFASSGIANYDFTSSGSTLSAGATYWVLVYGTADGNSVDWTASSPGVTPTGIASHVGYLWGTSGPPPTSNSSILNSYSCTATMVPVELQAFTIE